MTSAEVITNRIVSEMEKTGTLVWHKPWKSMLYRNAVSHHAYRGINVLMLALFGKDEFYMTFNQAKANGGSVKKGSKSIPIVFYNVTPEKRDASGNVVKDKHYFLRYYNVFGISDTENVKVKLPEIAKLDFEPIAEAERLISALGLQIKQASSAFYVPSEHAIYMPPKERFMSVPHYYATLFHELTHYCAKEVGVKLENSFGDEAYSKEELVAEIGANFLLSHCGIDASATFDNSIAYLQSWTKKLTKEPRLLISAAAQAQKRFDWVLSKANTLPVPNTLPVVPEVEPDGTEVVEAIAA